MTKKNYAEIDNYVKNKLNGYHEETSKLFWYRLYFRIKRKPVRIVLMLLLVLTPLIFAYLFWPVEFSNQPVGIADATINVVVDQTDPVIGDKRSQNSDPLNTIPINDSRAVKDNIPLKSVINESFDTKKSVNNDMLSIIDNPKNREYITITEIGAIQSSINSFNNVHELKSQPGTSVFQYYIEPGKRKTNLSISLELAPSVVWKTLSSDIDHSDLMQYRKDNEQVIYTTQLGIKLSYNYRKWIFTAGIGYHTFGEKLNYHFQEEMYDPESSYYQPDTIWGFIYDPPILGEPIVLGYDSSWVEVYQSIIHKTEYRNNYKYYEIPVIIGYQIDFGRFSLVPAAGVSFGFLSNSNGKVLLENRTDFLNFSKRDDMFNKVSFSLICELGVFYNIVNRHKIYLKPYYQANMKSIYNAYPLDDRYQSAGCGIGYSFYF